MTSNADPVKIGRTLREYLQQGLMLEQRVIDYMDATLARSDPDAVMALISDEDDMERDVLLELLFYPNEALQYRIEGLIAGEQYSRADEKRLQQELGGTIVPIYFPGKQAPVEIEMTPELAGCFVGRLHITRRLDLSINQVLDRWVAAELNPVLKVKLRNAGGRYSSSQVDFICTFIQQFDRDADNLLSCFDLILEIMSRDYPPGDMYQQLMRRKWICHRALWQTERHRKKLRQSSMEFLMMSGIRAPFVCRDDMTRKIKLIDIISTTVFGRTDDFRLQEWHHEM